MNDLKYTLRKNKSKIILTLSILIFIAISLGTYFYISNSKPEETPSGEVYEDEFIKLADYVFLANEKGAVDLLKTSDMTISNNINLGDNTIYSRDNNLEYIMAFNNGVFYKISETDGLIEKEEVFKIEDKNLKEFKFNSEYIVGFTNDNMIYISLKDKKVNKTELKDVDTFTLYNSKLIYSKNKDITLLDLKDKKEKTIDVGEKTDLIFITNNDYIMCFNKFGQGLNKYSLLQIKADDLYVEKAYNHDNSKVIPISSDSDDKVVSFIDTVNKDNLTMQSIYSLDVTSEKNNKNRIAIQAKENSDGSEYGNSISTKGYMYSIKDTGMEIFDFRAESVKVTIPTDKSFFMPILK